MTKDIELLNLRSANKALQAKIEDQAAELERITDLVDDQAISLSSQAELENMVPLPSAALLYVPLTRREQFAMVAMQGILAGHFGDTIPHDDVNGGSDAAFFAVNYADALIAKLDENGEGK